MHLHRAALLAGLLAEAQRDVDRRADDADADDDRDPEERREQVEDLVRVRTRGPQRVLLVVGSRCLSPQPASKRRRQRDDDRRSSRAGSRCLRSNISLSRRLLWREDGCDSTAVDSPNRNSVISSRRDRWKVPFSLVKTPVHEYMFTSPGGRATRRGAASRGSTCTWVSRCTRDAEQRFELEPGRGTGRLAAPRRPCRSRCPFCESRSTRTTTRSASTDPPRFRRSSISSVVTAIECGSSSRAIGQQLLAHAARRRGTIRADR